MRKEIIFAVIAGGILGLIIAFGVWRANIALSLRSNGGSTSSPEKNSVPQFSISLASPDEKSVSVEAQIKVSGITAPSASIVVSAEDKDYFVSSEGNGGFETTVDLTPGVNQIVVSAFSQKGDFASQKLTVVYSSEFAKLIQTPSSTPQAKEATPSSEEAGVRQKVQQKVEEALKKPVAFIGVVTDIAEKTIQIKTDNGEIKQTSVNSDTTFVKSIKTTKEIKFADIAIGDFIVSMGLKNGNEVLEAKRILVTNPVTPTTRSAVYGKITDAGKSSLSLLLVKSQENSKISMADKFIVYSVKNDKLTKIKLSALSIGDLILGVGQNSQGTYDARTIFVVESATPTPKLTPTP